MNKYHLLMNGQNFIVDMDGKAAKHGFFQNFFLEADSPEQAENLAVRKIREDEELKAVVQNPKDDPPTILLEEMSEVEGSFDVEAMKSGKVWYREKKWWQFWK